MRKQHAVNQLTILLLAGCLFFGTAALGSGWYVGNTDSGEWIEYRNVKLAEGDYRFTARAGSTSFGNTLRFEIDNVPVQSNVNVPNTGRWDAFLNVHLGHTHVSAGYHNLKLYFETGQVSVDWFMLRKSSEQSDKFMPDDITMLPPPADDGPILAPIIGYGERGFCPNIRDKHDRHFTEAQLSTWYSWPMYADYDRRTDRWWDILIDELLASRVDTCMFHCRGTNNFTDSLDDRDYGGNNYEGRFMSKVVEVLERSPQAKSSIRLSCFFENGPSADGFFNKYGHYPSIGETEFIDYTFYDWLAPWFDQVPEHYLYKVNGRPIIKFYSGKPSNVIVEDKWDIHLARLQSLFMTRYGLDPLFIMAKQHVTDFSTNWQLYAWGASEWMSWDGPLSEVYAYGGQNWGTISSSSRRRIDTVWLNDWDPVTDSGGPYDCDAYDDFTCGWSSHQPRIQNGLPVLRDALQYQADNNTVIAMQEGFTNISEGNGLFRSNHPEWQYPNQYLGIMREFADTRTESLIFEAEACDEYYDTTSGNSGRQYRTNWYGGLTDIDIYRPLHNLGQWTKRTTSPTNLVQVDSGYFDTWAVDSSGNLWAMENDGVYESGSNTWRSVSKPATMKYISVAEAGFIYKNGEVNIDLEEFVPYAWGLAINGTPYYCRLPNNWDSWGHTSWVAKGNGFAQIDVGSNEVWSLKSDGSIYHCPADGDGDWMSVSGALSQVAVGRMFVWGINSLGRIFYCPVNAPGQWTEVENTYNLTQIDVGSEEVWGINAVGAIYRISAAGVGDWQPVPGALDYVTIGNDYVWGLDGGSTKNMEIDGFYTGDLALAGDANNDNTVDLGDFSLMSGQWQVSGCQGAAWCDGTDVNRDGQVNLLDLVRIAEAWLMSDLLPGQLALLDEDSDLDLTGNFAYLVNVGDITASCPLEVSDGVSTQTFAGDIDADGPYPPTGFIAGYTTNYTKAWDAIAPAAIGLSVNLKTVLKQFGEVSDSGTSPLQVTLDVAEGRTYKLQLVWYYGLAEGRNYMFDVYIEGSKVLDDFSPEREAVFLSSLPVQAAVMYSQTLTAVDGQINIDLANSGISYLPDDNKPFLSLLTLEDLTTNPSVQNWYASVNSTTTQLSGRVTDTGGENPNVTIFWGDNDGGATAGNWDYSIDMGTRHENFLVDVGAAEWFATNYFRCYARNSVGEDWADTSLSFYVAHPTAYLVPGVVQAEDWSAMSGVSTENTSDENGGLNVGWIDNGDWMEYEVYAALAGDYTVEYRVASNSSTVKFNLKKGSAVLGSISTAITGGWQSWKTVSHNVTLTQGLQTLKVQATSGGWNFNWLNLVPAVVPVATNLPASMITSNSARLNGQVDVGDGAEPNVKVYYGDNDGSTTALNWDYSIDLGILSGAFEVDVAELTGATNYYYRVYASNAAGSDWAESAQVFRTFSGVAPIVENLSVTDITSTTARLNGHVDTGGAVTSVTIYWGDNNGGSVVTSWDHSLLLDSESGLFLVDITGLTNGKTYYYRCQATNSVGSDWADSTATFTAGQQVSLLHQDSDLDLTGSFDYLVSVGDREAYCPVQVSDGISTQTFVGDINGDGPYPPVGFIDGYDINYQHVWNSPAAINSLLSPNLRNILRQWGYKNDNNGSNPLRVNMDVIAGRSYKLQLAWHYGWVDGRDYIFDVCVDGIKVLDDVCPERDVVALGGNLVNDGLLFSKEFVAPDSKLNIRITYAGHSNVNDDWKAFLSLLTLEDITP